MKRKKDRNPLPEAPEAPEGGAPQTGQLTMTALRLMISDLYINETVQRDKANGLQRELATAQGMLVEMGTELTSAQETIKKLRADLKEAKKNNR